jgi:hypothetical protein
VPGRQGNAGLPGMEGQRGIPGPKGIHGSPGPPALRYNKQQAASSAVTKLYGTGSSLARC